MKVTEGRPLDPSGSTTTVPPQVNDLPPPHPLAREPLTRLPSKLEGKDVHIPEETRVVNEGIESKPGPGLPLTVGGVFPYLSYS